MSATLSPSANKRYGIARVCRVWGMPRSTQYHRLAVSRRVEPRLRPGPKPTVSDEEVAEMIGTQHQELEEKYGLRGEGYRKAWARLRHAGVCLGKERVRRIMREHGLLAPSRTGRYHGPKIHDGTIQTDLPDQMWGTDATRVWTPFGYPWIFIAIDHCSGECIGVHASLSGHRFAALVPLQDGVREHFGDLEAGVASGLKIRHDHGSQYMSEAFQAELSFLGAESSPSFVASPQGNGIAERFIRTLKEQLLWVVSTTSLEELQQALQRFRRNYNEHWLLERHGHITPSEVRRRLKPSSGKAA